MPTPPSPPSDPSQILRQIRALRQALSELGSADGEAIGRKSLVTQLVDESGALIPELQALRERISPVRFGSIAISLGRSDGIAKFFAFSFCNQPKRPLSELLGAPFFGSGVYAIYYEGECEESYRPLSGTETPIYVGKANPAIAQAETVEQQGQKLWERMKEHAKNIERATLPLSDFRYRAAPIQTGMQASVEDFMIRLFKPIWNKEIKICFGIGKHGDSAKTRANKRSPWDTMHPGRRWAADTLADQRPRADVETRIREHLQANPPIRDQETLFKLLSLD